MPKICSTLGFVKQQESVTEPGIWENVTTEKIIYPEVLKYNKSQEADGQINSNININCQFSFIADPYATANIDYMKYITYLGKKWQIKSVDISYPRLVISVGGLYNGN